MAMTEFSFNWGGSDPKKKEEEPPKNILTTVQDWLQRYGVSEDKERSYQYRGYPTREAQPQQPAQRYVPSYGQIWQNWMNGRQYTPYATRGYGGVRTDPYISGQRTPAQPYGYPTLLTYQQQRQAAAQRAANAYAQRYRSQNYYQSPTPFQNYLGGGTRLPAGEAPSIWNQPGSPKTDTVDIVRQMRAYGETPEAIQEYIAGAMPVNSETGANGGGYGYLYPYGYSYPFFYGGGGGGYTYSTPKKTRYYNDLMMWNINKPGE